ncbi:MAG: S8 family serine peptidase [Fimbriimonadaceae bacterium]|nr:S8 family serine peptidase [Fimbriimonadaceae bacterium]
MKTKLLALVSLALVAGASPAQTRYILRYTESEPLSVFLARYGLQREATVPQRPIHAVIDPRGRNPRALITRISDDTDDDVSLELDQIVRLPILGLRATANQNIDAVRRAAAATRPVPFFRTQVPSGFLTQPAVAQIDASATWSAFGGGRGTVAVIDTGVDPTHPVLRPVVLPGLDFLDPRGNGSELRGLDAGVLALINPTTTPLLTNDIRHLSRGHAPAWEPSARLNSAFSRIPIGLGHGTMVAGAVRLAAPEARILPIRAFSQNGTGRLYHVIAGIHAAELRGARVVNLSLNTLVHSPELERTVEEVSDRGLILVASTGNEGLTNPVSYPAVHRKVTAITSVDIRNRRSVFANAGDQMTWAAAPGEALYLPFPGGRYAGGWGTSFAAPLASGLAAQVLSRKPDATYSDVQSALGSSRSTGDPNLGLGILSLFRSTAGI